MTEIIHLPQRELTKDQQEYWELALENAERARDYALRMLGRLAVEEDIT